MVAGRRRRHSTNATTTRASISYEDTAVMSHNNDTPYPFAWLDLRAEPMVISVPGS